LISLKHVWVHIEGWSEELAAAALESGADALVLPEGLAGKAKALGIKLEETILEI